VGVATNTVRQIKLTTTTITTTTITTTIKRTLLPCYSIVTFEVGDYTVGFSLRGALIGLVSL